MKFAVPSAKVILSKIAIRAILSLGPTAVRTRKRFTLFILNKFMDDIISTIKSLKKWNYLNWWSYWDSKSWNERKTRRWTLGTFLTSMAALLIAHMISSSIENVHRKRVSEIEHRKKGIYSIINTLIVFIISSKRCH